jgi:hypothetical protein
MWAGEPMDKMTVKSEFRLLTMDLDDTLWPSGPTIERAETSLYAWLEQTAPRLTRACDREAMRLHRSELMASRPDIAHNWMNRRGNRWPDDLDPPVAEVADLADLRRWLTM